MSLTSLAPLLRQDPALAAVVGRSSATLAVPEPARALAVAALGQLSQRRPLLVVVPSHGDAERLVHDIGAFMGPDQVEAFPAWETLPFERVSPAVETMGRRLRTIWRLRSGSPPAVLVATVKAVLQRLVPDTPAAEPVVVRVGERVDPEQLVARLVAMGYRREYQVEHRGELAVRGGIVDVFPSTSDAPVRIDLWGDEVDRLNDFDVFDQRSTTPRREVEVFGCRELVATERVRARAAALVGAEPWGRDQWDRLAEGLVFDGMESWLPWLADEELLLTDLLGPEAQVLLVEPRRMRDRAAEVLDEEAALAASLAQTWGAGSGEAGFPALHLGFDRLLARTAAGVLALSSVPEGPDSPAVSARGWDPVVGDAHRLAAQLSGLARSGYRVVVCAEGEGSAARISARLGEEGLVVASPPADGAAGWLPPAGVTVLVQPLDRGFVIDTAKLAVLAESDVTGRRRVHRRPSPRARQTEGFFDDLAPGDYVVHHHHGVARYGGMVTRAIGGAERDYLLLEYRGGDKLYVPSDQIDAITPYTGGDSPSLSRLGGADWQRTRARVRAAVREVAQELVVLYRRRVTSTGHAFPADTPWQTELEEAFPYSETPDQVKAIREVKEDMERPVPMDRLLCGDVGFGKTEVAIRAVFKAVQDGKQAAVLVPTTLLAQQHFQTFSDRFAGYPVRVEVLSRFLTPAQAKAVTEDVATGAVDVVIGTHRLLSGDVRFANLGLLVVDEEQRFGVTHKELIKQLQTDVDVLTLTATPIPRTLEMSLTGIRDLTLLNTPPADRQPILTFVGEMDERAVSEAIRRELLREGQVFYVHNRVKDIEMVAARVRELVPEARLAVAHGQMDEGSLEKVVLDFWDGQYDVLVCTTIIESGIDMPTVNTLVVDHAERLGLGQLHQLRGRVGRAGQRAYAYLFFPPERQLSEQAYERLRTIGEHTELGSGFKIAMRDLEIRGAGNLLGSDQSGHIAAVGYDLYVRMVSEAVAELKGEELRPPAEIKLDLPVDAHLPTDYVEREDLRLEAYRRLAGVTTQAEVDDIEAEWLDRFGPLPEPARAVLGVGRLRAECARTGVREVAVVKGRTGPGLSPACTARISPLPSLLTSARMRLSRLYPKAVYKEDQSQLVVPLGPKQAADPAGAIIELLGELLPPEDAPAPEPEERTGAGAGQGTARRRRPEGARR
ncbi:MAG TPA: transcription-repair coupling factor [Acidimicrobiales bacterium]|nr:transcription-repair coupling factor [Acidimicrobiales bacterium]